MFRYATFVALFTALMLFPDGIMAYWKGFSLGANTATGACKTQQDWDADFIAIRSWNKGFNAIRLFAASDCNTLANAVPAAKSHGLKLLVGIWATDGTHYGNEKAALLSAIKAHGTSWIVAVSVGSEDLYRGDISPQNLANEIYDVRGMVHQFNSGIQVGHTDTWTAWVNGANDVVTRASDFILMDGYPYWQGATISNANQVFFQSLTDTRNHVNAVKPGIQVWIGETGWPSVGDIFNAAVPSRPNAQKYWKYVACQVFKEANVFWFTAFDTPTASPKVEQGFGVAYYNRQLKISLDC